MGLWRLGCLAVLTALPHTVMGQPIPVEVRSVESGYALYRGGQPYQVRGAGVAVDAAGAKDLMTLLASTGGNSVRTWHVGDGWFLDAAHELGLTVALCLDLERERHGFDYGDAAAVAAQREEVRAQLLRHKDHPALLAWVIGNELNYGYTDPRVYDAVNDISRMIHELDPHHPTTTTTADFSSELAAVISARAPDLDFISVQTYGGVFDLPERIAAAGVSKPVMITEWGTIGHWEVPRTEWGAPLELNSTQKAQTYARAAYDVLPRMGGQLIGSYAFLWGQKQERTPTWYGIFVDGRPTQAVEVLNAYWSGQAAGNQAPRIEAVRLDGQDAQDSVRVVAGKRYNAKVHIADPEGAPLKFRWSVMEESAATEGGGDAERVPAEWPEAIVRAHNGEAIVAAPKARGAYRLFVYAVDDRGSVAHANLPFFVDLEDGS